ncbi:G-type lectin S-receptor-like serine/threonine-protein kinase CES101 isoform X2 [Argentina anserina]|uniref:G-type lectin S-receptor-like serine/threonine-protein kinase CES101 isoform X2 n=1 Tax=Argentina anserina TaxID=57926 RepID=UPI00217621C0|nr:G-type lectin S-receptor-like serine/threonine-protein kinase CES101 isoform X2 [Potentilla anserina]
MACSLYLILFLFLSSLWSTCNGAINTLEPGDTLNSSSSLISANEKFILSFRRYDDASSLSYLVIKWHGSKNYAWVANPYTPVLYPFGVLTLDRKHTLKITPKDGDPVVLYSASETGNSSVLATLLDDGNFVLQEVSSDRLSKRVLWQSFDYPGDVLLPGSFTLDWDPEEHELKVRRRGVVYWSSGVFRDGSFANFKHKKYNFSIVSNENEDYFSYSAVDQNARPQWLLTTIGRLYDFDGSVDIAKVDSCYGYNTEGGCQIWDAPSKCRDFGDVFRQDNGYFNPIGPIAVTSSSDSNTSLSISDCKATCWADCNCRGFIFLFPNQTGCRYWTGDLQFIADRTGYSSSVVYFLTKRSASSHSHKWIWTGAAIATALLVLVLCIVCWWLRRKKLVVSGKNKIKIDELKLHRSRGSDISIDVHGTQTDGSMGQDLRAFSYKSVMTATEYFSLENKIGEGGFGPVYKGKMLTGQEIAVKALSSCSGQGEVEFKNELILVSELQHTNLVKLFGFCIHDKERMLIYEYMPNKGLDNILFDSTRRMLLDWKKRFNIIEGIAQGLLYLHKYSRLKVIHRDLKASNILLDENMKPKISDFGMARSFMLNEVEANTRRIVGTHGYMSPEYAMQGIFSGKSDVFSFGVLMLEIISGRKNNSFHSTHRALNLVGYAWQLWQEGAGLELMDETLSDSCVENQLIRCIHVGLLCVEEDPELRPTMSEAISMLTNESLPLPIPTRPASFPVRHPAAADTRGTNSEILSENGLSTSVIIGR